MVGGESKRTKVEGAKFVRLGPISTGDWSRREYSIVKQSIILLIKPLNPPKNHPSRGEKVTESSHPLASHRAAGSRKKDPSSPETRTTIPSQAPQEYRAPYSLYAAHPRTIPLKNGPDPLPPGRAPDLHLSTPSSLLSCPNPPLHLSRLLPLDDALPGRTLAVRFLQHPPKCAHTQL